MLEPVCSAIQSVASQYEVFVNEIFYKSGDSVVRTQHLFRYHFDIGQNEKFRPGSRTSYPDAKSVAHFCPRC